MFQIRQHKLKPVDKSLTGFQTARLDDGRLSDLALKGELTTHSLDKCLQQHGTLVKSEGLQNFPSGLNLCLCHH